MAMLSQSMHAGSSLDEELHFEGGWAGCRPPSSLGFLVDETLRTRGWAWLQRRLGQLPEGGPGGGRTTGKMLPRSFQLSHKQKRIEGMKPQPRVMGASRSS
jgi:hypothetical protein